MRVAAAALTALAAGATSRRDDLVADLPAGNSVAELDNLTGALVALGDLWRVAHLEGAVNQEISEWQIPQYATLTRTSFGPGFGIGTSSIRISLVSVLRRCAFIVPSMTLSFEVVETVKSFHYQGYACRHVLAHRRARRPGHMLNENVVILPGYKSNVVVTAHYLAVGGSSPMTT